MVPFTRVIARHTTEYAGNAAWVSPVIATLAFTIQIFLMRYLVKQNEGKNLAEINRAVLGKVLGNIINVLYVIWFFVLAAYYLRQFGERMATTVFFDTSSSVFIAVMLFCVGFALNQGPTVIIRTGSIFFYALAAVFILSSLAMLPQMDFRNLLPVSSLDTKGVICASGNVISAFGYGIIYLVYFGDVDSKGFTKNIVTSTVLGGIMSIIAIMIPIGAFSAKVVSEMIFPFFSAAKGIEVFDSIERVEAVIIAFFILADFIVIAFTLMSAQKMLCQITGSGKTTPYYNMLLLGTFVFILYLGNSALRLNEFSKKVIIPANLVLGIFIPIVLFIVCIIKSFVYRKKEPLLH